MHLKRCIFFCLIIVALFPVHAALAKDISAEEVRQGEFGITEAIENYENVRRMGADRYLAEAPLYKQGGKAMAGDVGSILAAMDEQGRWKQDGWIYAATFVENFGELCDFLEQANSSEVQCPSSKLKDREILNRR